MNELLKTYLLARMSVEGGGRKRLKDSNVRRPVIQTLGLSVVKRLNQGDGVGLKWALCAR